jgi:hypothetical protein
MKPQQKSCLNCERLQRVDGRFACGHFIKGIPNSILLMKETCPFHSWKMQPRRISRGRVPGKKQKQKPSLTQWEG